MGSMKCTAHLLRCKVEVLLDVEGQPLCAVEPSPTSCVLENATECCNGDVTPTSVSMTAALVDRSMLGITFAPDIVGRPHIRSVP